MDNIPEHPNNQALLKKILEEFIDITSDASPIGSGPLRPALPFKSGFVLRTESLRRAKAVERSVARAVS